ncbi:hypothetical protein ACQ4LK_25395, partial [Bacillus pumilus]
SYGRFPHQNGFGRLSNEDKRIIRWALEETGMIAFHDRPIEALSGGQRPVSYTHSPSPRDPLHDLVCRLMLEKRGGGGGGGGG